ncbi:MAG: flagellar basal body P-ring formation protein FlgA [Nitrosomonas sp.]|nr:flagellar basal body P-ring formation protein FlgA [Nitrosomonas sp.]MBX3639125.1 flagellar basal body P-ring formation protein FlgA [Nitrosomonas sp.]MCW5606470.1 flagellar basal body P-ring formation protein FlgA [Nitrosomonas sp.]
MRSTRLKLLAFLLLIKISFQLSAANALSQYQDIALIQNAVKDFIYSHTVSPNAAVQVEVGQIDNRITLPKCARLEPFIPPGSRLWGKTSVGVRCDGESGWTIYVPAEVRIMANVLYVARPVARDQTIGFDDLSLQVVNLAQFPEGIFTEYSQAVGKIAAVNITAGQPMRPNMVRAPFVILRGQNVKLTVVGRGFSVSSEGQALSDASDGQVLQVRNTVGRIISGLARHNGIVEVQP